MKDCQESFNPEVSILFLNAAKKFQFSTEQHKHLDSILQDYLVELVREEVQEDKGGNSKKIKTNTNLLADDVYGMERLC
jgi:hypothetical protein